MEILTRKKQLVYFVKPRLVDTIVSFYLNRDLQNDTLCSSIRTNISAVSSAFYVRYWNPDVATEQWLARNEQCENFRFRSIVNSANKREMIRVPRRGRNFSGKRAALPYIHMLRV